VSCKVLSDQLCGDTAVVGKQPPHYGINRTWAACIRYLAAAEGLGPQYEVALHWRDAEMARNKIVSIAFAIEKTNGQEII